jgi:CheY-like chemotaxis protein
VRPLEILVAEDNRGDVTLIRHALDVYEVPHQLHVVTDGEEAIKFIRQMGRVDGSPRPDLFLLDLNLPKADGPQVLYEFRRHPECAKTPVIVVSSSEAPRDRVQIADLGITRYFRKPNSYDEFMELGSLVREVVEEVGS